MNAMLGNGNGTTTLSGTSGTNTNRPNFVISGNKGPTVNPTTGYTWNPTGLGTAQTIYPFPATVPTTTYKVTISDANGCSYNDSTTVTVNPLPTLLNATNSTQCGAGIPTCSVTDPNALYFTDYLLVCKCGFDYTTSSEYKYDIYYFDWFYNDVFMFSVENPSTLCLSPRKAVTATVIPSDSILGKAKYIKRYN